VSSPKESGEKKSMLRARTSLASLAHVHDGDTAKSKAVTALLHTAEREWATTHLHTMKRMIEVHMIRDLANIVMRMLAPLIEEQWAAEEDEAIAAHTVDA
jgi:hypothetical protein